MTNVVSLTVTSVNELGIWHKGKLPQKRRIKAQVSLLTHLLTCATLWDHFYPLGATWLKSSGSYPKTRTQTAWMLAQVQHLI